MDNNDDDDFLGAEIRDGGMVVELVLRHTMGVLDRGPKRFGRWWLLV